MKPTVEDMMAAYRTELLRWNSSINLVSRQDTESRVDALLRQCRDACSLLLEAAEPLNIGTVGDLLYLDVGSGAGLPGYVWNLVLAQSGHDPATWLIEPRDKRAWFLRRIARRGDLTIRVLQGRWGEVFPPEPLAPDRVLVSFKALRMSDPEVLAGLKSFCCGPETELTIARFCPHDQAWDEDLQERLEIPAAGTTHPWTRGEATALSGGVLVPGNPGADTAGLIISRYRLTAS